MPDSSPTTPRNPPANSLGTPGSLQSSSGGHSRRFTMDRRNFLASSMTGSILAASSTVATTAAAAEITAAEVTAAGLVKATIPTPALVVDLDTLEANIKKMADHCLQAKIGFR